jgi:acyl dehydratase
MNTSVTTVTNIDALREFIGRELGTGQWLELTQERIDAYAEETGEPTSDRHVAQPFLLLGMTNLLQRNRAGVRVDIPARSNVNYGLNNVEFVSSAHIGTRLRARTKLVNVEQVRDDVMQITYGITVEADGAGEPVLRAEMLSRLYL